MNIAVSSPGINGLVCKKAGYCDVISYETRRSVFNHNLTGPKCTVMIKPVSSWYTNMALISISMSRGMKRCPAAERGYRVVAIKGLCVYGEKTGSNVLAEFISSININRQCFQQFIENWWVTYDFHTHVWFKITYIDLYQLRIWSFFKQSELLIRLPLSIYICIYICIYIYIISIFRLRCCPCPIQYGVGITIYNSLSIW